MLISVSPASLAYDNIPVPYESVTVVKKNSEWTAAFNVPSSQTVAQYIKYDGNIKGVEVPTAGFSNSNGD